MEGKMVASIATGQQLTGDEYMSPAEVCALINDLVDLRSDTMRKQRENVVVRGVRGSAYHYLNTKLLKCIEGTRRIVNNGKLTVLVAMAFCNWALMASHHKVYELTRGLEPVEGSPRCEYVGLESYNQLLEALSLYGTARKDSPHVQKTRSEMDKLYKISRLAPPTHLAWLADATRILLDSIHFWPIVDVVHYQWSGEVGDAEYCP